MSSPERDNLYERMSEASLLPPDDPQRLEVMREIAAAGSEATGRWLELLRQDEELRLALNHLAVAPGLEAKLLAVPDTVLSHRVNWQRTLRWALGVAAILLLALASVWLLLRARTSNRLETLALLAVNNHINQPPLLVHSSDPEQVEAVLKGRMPFPVEVYKTPPGMRLLGGGTCFVGSHPAAFMRYQRDGQPATLFLLASDSVKLPRTFPKAVVTPGAIWAGGQHYRVAIWADQDIACTWALVLSGDESANPFLFPL